MSGDIRLVGRLPDGRLFAVMGFTMAGGTVVEMRADLGGSPIVYAGSIEAASEQREVE